MSGDITPTSAVLELARLSRQLDEAGFKIRPAERDAVQKRHEFTVAQAKSFLTAEGSIQARQAQALIDTAELRVAAELAEAEVRILKSDIRILEGRMDVGRSVVGVLRAEAQVVR
jgi:hypothetical protein